ncbi:uncharacterized protein P884DRAFT_279798 [Thermothelomyces heterothallicus CBS 202.75]|uniref:uncharacterized protein n=1 Tax=Thermothelomyces heterothallicus CBS 202.75 TaxID=1149848 RepID=UPI0037426BCF
MRRSCSPAVFISQFIIIAASAQKEAPARQQIEIDAVSPRDETYREAQISPIVFAVQSMTAIRDGSTTANYSTAGILSDEGSFLLRPNDTGTGPGLFKPGWGSEDKEKYMFQWYLFRLADEGGHLHSCVPPKETDSHSSSNGHVIFQAKSDAYLRFHGLEDADYLHNVTDIPECPDLLEGNVTPTIG